MANAEAEEVLKLCKEAAAKITELACTVQIFVTIHDTECDTTRHMHTGLGNWYARESQVREWVMENDERVRIKVHEENEGD